MDRLSIAKFAILVGFGNLVFAAAPDTCQAGLFGGSCLFRRNQETPPPVTTTTFYPTTAAVAAPAAAPAAGCCGPAQCQQTVLRYVPQVSYRTVWQPVPVTQYRRTVSYNPATGLPITCTQPCTTYTYQARRVPYTTFRPTYATVPVTQAAYAAPAVAVTPAPGCASCSATAPAPAASPYYSTTPPATAAPALPPSTGTTPQPGPWEPVNPSTGVAPAPAPSMGGDAADLQPSIPPEIQPDIGSQRSSQRLQTNPTNNGSRVPENNGLTNQYNSLRGYDGAASSQTNRATDNSSLQPNTFSNTAPNSARSSSIDASPTPSNRYNLQPLPNRDPPPPSSGKFNSDTPQFNAPRDNTASPVRARWASSQITWPEPADSLNTNLPAVRRLDSSRIQSSSATTGSDFRSETPRTELHRFSSDSNVSKPWADDGWTSAASYR